MFCTQRQSLFRVANFRAELLQLRGLKAERCRECDVNVDAKNFNRDNFHGRGL